MSNQDIDLLKDAEDAAKYIEKSVEKGARPIFKRYPLTFTFLSMFGFASVLFGFERFFETIPLFNDNPLGVLALGIVILSATGTLYKWLQNREVRP